MTRSEAIFELAGGEEAYRSQLWPDHSAIVERAWVSPSFGPDEVRGIVEALAEGPPHLDWLERLHPVDRIPFPKLTGAIETVFDAVRAVDEIDGRAAVYLDLLITEAERLDADAGQAERDLQAARATLDAHVPAMRKSGETFGSRERCKALRAQVRARERYKAEVAEAGARVEVVRAWWAMSDGEDIGPR